MNKRIKKPSNYGPRKQSINYVTISFKNAFQINGNDNITQHNL